MPGIPEMLIIAAVVFILFGGKKFASFGRDIGSGIRNLRSGLKEATKDEDQE